MPTRTLISVAVDDDANITVSGPLQTRITNLLQADAQKALDSVKTDVLKALLLTFGFSTDGLPNPTDGAG